MLHFETRATKPLVFRITPRLIEEAKRRSGEDVATSYGEDWSDLFPIKKAIGLVTSIDLLADPKFPKADIAIAAPHLRWIHVTGAGIEPLLPLDWLPSQVALTNNSGVHAEKVRESATMMLLMLHGRLPAMISNQRNSHWQQIFTPSIRGRTVVIIGVGEMGGAVAHAARALGLRVIGVRKSGKSHPAVDQMIQLVDINKVLPEADLVVCCLPLTQETYALFDKSRFKTLKKGAGFANIGRAGSVDYDALINALSEGHVSGAILDVYENEPLPDVSPLWQAPNLVMMPHVSSDDEDLYMPKTLDLVFKNAARLKQKMPLLNLVDRQLGY